MSQQYDYTNQGPEFNLKKYRPIILTALVIIVLIIVAMNSFVILNPTEKGVIFYKYGEGLDTENVYDEGLNVLAPWNEMLVFDVSEQEAEEVMDVLSQDGLSIRVETSIRFRPIAAEIGLLYKRFQKDYKQRFVIPELRSAVRTVIGKYKPEELYSTKRTAIETEIEEIMESKLGANSVEMEALLLKSITLPPNIVNAIETKLEEEQKAKRYEFTLMAERKEAERKIIASQGEQMANAILDSSLTENLLRMRGIEATLKLSNSPNSKVIVIGGSDGMPLILGNN